MIKLSMGDVMRSAFVALWRRRWIAGAIVLAWLLVDLIAGLGRLNFIIMAPTGVLDRISTSVTGFGMSQPLPMNLLATGALYALVGSVFAVLLVRLLVLGSPFGAVTGSAGLAWSMVSVLVLNLTMGVAYRLANFAAYEIIASEPLLFWRHTPLSFGLLAIWLFAIWIGSRVCLAYADATLGNGWQIRRAWQRTAGHSLRLSMLIGCIHIAERYIGEMVEGIFPVESLSAVSIPLAMVALVFPASLVRVIANTLFLALFAVVYVRLTGFPAVGVPGAPRSPRQTADAFD